MEPNQNVLLVEDDQDLRELIVIAGEKLGYSFEAARNGLEAIDIIERKAEENGRTPDIIILDINMPGMDGFSFCRWLRDSFPKIPVIFLSARSGEFDKILALEIGGDDYLTKPFSMKELFARVAVSLRRVRLYSDAGQPEPQVEAGDLKMNPETWMCSYRGSPVMLTVSEFRILHKLAGNPGVVNDRNRLAAAAFPDDSYNSGRSIDIHISRIRAKIQEIDPDFSSIETVFQVGYKWKS